MEAHNVMYASAKSKDTKRSTVKNYMKKQSIPSTTTTSSIVPTRMSVLYTQSQFKDVIGQSKQ